MKRFAVVGGVLVVSVVSLLLWAGGAFAIGGYSCPTADTCNLPPSGGGCPGNCMIVQTGQPCPCMAFGLTNYPWSGYFGNALGGTETFSYQQVGCSQYTPCMGSMHQWMDCNINICDPTLPDNSVDCYNCSSGTPVVSGWYENSICAPCSES
jgi:hypothetical protein